MEQPGEYAADYTLGGNRLERCGDCAADYLFGGNRLEHTKLPMGHTFDGHRLERRGSVQRITRWEEIVWNDAGIAQRVVRWTETAWNKR